MSYQVIRNETAGAVFGVPGRFFNVIADPSNPAIIRNQKWIGHGRPIGGYGEGATLTVEIRFDDEHQNGHNSFSITAHVARPGARDWEACGCLHDDIAQVFPELAPLIRWHLSSTDGPMHYLANVIYLAGDRDCHGLRIGEERQIRNGRTGKLAWRLAAIVGNEYKDARVSGVAQYVNSETQPAAPCDGLVYAPWNQVGEGKARELEAARRVAVWPDATDEQLCADPADLKAALIARLPALLAEMRDDITRAGFMWAQE